jgi:hypothetical protein
MKRTSRSLYLRIAAIAVGLSFGLSAYAETPREEVAHAFHLLQKADHDYAGHRAKAMAEVEIAGRSLKLELGGEIPDRERQWKSDEQMAEARRLLREARDKLEKRDRDIVADHIDTAVKEIDIALAVK